MSDHPIYLCIRTGTARKAGLHSTGTLSYAILKDAEATEVFFMVTGNSSSGYYSREAIPLTKIETCLASLPSDTPIPAKALRPCFLGKSANDGGFLLALLRHEGLLALAPAASNLSIKSGDWKAWREAVLTETGERFELPTKQVKTTMTAAVTATAAKASITNEPTSVLKGKKVRKNRDAQHVHPSGTAEVEGQPLPVWPDLN